MCAVLIKKEKAGGRGAKEIEKRKEKKEVQYHLAMFQTHLEMHSCKSGHRSLRDFQSRARSSKSKLAKSTQNHVK